MLVLSRKVGQEVVIGADASLSLVVTAANSKKRSCRLRIGRRGEKNAKEVSRVRSEQFTLEGGVSVMIVDVRAPANVRLGITAPQHIPVHRREVYDRIHEGRKSGA